MREKGNCSKTKSRKCKVLAIPDKSSGVNLFVGASSARQIQSKDADSHDQICVKNDSLDF